MKLSTKENILIELCKAAGTDVGPITKSEVWKKLAAIKANSRNSALVKIAAEFGFEDHHVAACK